MVVNQTSADSITGFFPNGNRSPTVCSQCAILPENRNRPLNDRPRFHTLKEVCGMERLAPERQVLIPYAHAFNGQWSLQACSFVFPGGGPVDPLLRASNEALPRARVPRAQRTHEPTPSHPLRRILSPRFFFRKPSIQGRQDHQRECR